MLLYVKTMTHFNSLLYMNLFLFLQNIIILVFMKAVNHVILRVFCAKRYTTLKLKAKLRVYVASNDSDTIITSAYRALAS